MNHEEYSICVECMEWAYWWFLKNHRDLMVERYDRKTKTTDFVPPVVHVSNEGQMTPKRGRQTNQMGRRAGFLDYVVPVPRNGYGALYLEGKRPGGKVTDRNQKNWVEFLDRFNKVVVFDSVIGFQRAIEEYFR